MKYVVYAHKDRDGELFYIGCGTMKRARTPSRRSRTWFDCAFRGAGVSQYAVEIWWESESKSDALKLEDFLIKSLKPKANSHGKNLPRNANSTRSEEWRRKVSESMKGNTNSAGHQNNKKNKTVRPWGLNVHEYLEEITP